MSAAINLTDLQPWETFCQELDSEIENKQYEGYHPKFKHLTDSMNQYFHNEQHNIFTKPNMDEKFFCSKR